MKHRSLESVRCPACGNTESAIKHEGYKRLGGGEHDVICPNCAYEYMISSHKGFIYTSPELLAGNVPE